jgi:putative transposase
MRKDSLVVGYVYHVFTKSIAEFRIFNNEDEFLRILNVMCYYQRESQDSRYSIYNRQYKLKQKQDFKQRDIEKLVEIISYCVMPTHLHLILKQVKENGISIFMNNVLNSYTRYFNVKHKRKGPLWEGRFKSVLVESDEQLLHLTRYIHLNPVTAYLVDKPEEWLASSYKEYLTDFAKDRICDFKEILDIQSDTYKEFVDDRISYQRDLARIKKMSFD